MDSLQHRLVHMTGLGADNTVCRWLVKIDWNPSQLTDKSSNYSPSTLLAVKPSGGKEYFFISLGYIFIYFEVIKELDCTAQCWDCEHCTVHLCSPLRTLSGVPKEDNLPTRKSWFVESTTQIVLLMISMSNGKYFFIVAMLVDSRERLHVDTHFTVLGWIFLKLKVIM